MLLGILNKLNRQIVPPLLGRIAIGEKTEKGLPSKVDHFLFTLPFDSKTKEAKIDQAMTEIMEAKYGKKIKRFSCILPFHHPEEVFFTRFARYEGATCDCQSRDGKNAIRITKDGVRIEVDCDFQNCDYKFDKKDREVCGARGILTVIIPESPRSGGVWKFATQGENTLVKLGQQLYYLYETRGTLKNLQVDLVYSMEVRDVPGQGRQNIPVIGVEAAYDIAALSAGSGTVFGKDLKTLLDEHRSQGSIQLAVLNDLENSAAQLEAIDITPNTSGREREALSMNDDKPRRQENEERSERRTRSSSRDDNRPF